MTSTAPSSTLVLNCTFCYRPDTEVARLIAGPGVYICDECVRRCDDILATDPPEASVSRISRWEKMTDDELLSHLPRIAATANSVERDLHQWVAEARARGTSWTRVGQALSITRQSAWERFSGED